LNFDSGDLTASDEVHEGSDSSYDWAYRGPAIGRQDDNLGGIQELAVFQALPAQVYPQSNLVTPQPSRQGRRRVDIENDSQAAVAEVSPSHSTPFPNCLRNGHLTLGRDPSWVEFDRASEIGFRLAPLGARSPFLV
jgi:hypothetical protein